MIDLSTIPLVALSNGTKELISTLLNPIKCIPSEDGLLRDWRGLADLSGLGCKDLPNLSSKPDPCGYILSMMQEKARGFTLSEFQALLERLDRWDIIDDTMCLMEKDARAYKERCEKILTSANVIEDDVDEQALTKDDIYRIAQGLEVQNYDAFLLFDDEDVNFANEICDNLENKNGLKLCRKDRDFIIGLQFEHTATMTLISERCNRLLVVVSPNFLKSSANKFFLNYAQAVGIDKRQRKIIPCLYQKCKLPPELSYYFTLDYSRGGQLWDFWGRLRDSVRTPQKPTPTARSIMPPATIQKSHSSENVCCEVKGRCCEETRCLKEIHDQPCETRQACVTEIKEERSAPVLKKKNGLPLRYFKKTKIQRMKPTTEQSSLAELQPTDSLPSLESSTYSSTLSLPETSRKKKNFVHKYVNKVRGLMKSQCND